MPYDPMTDIWPPFERRDDGVVLVRIDTSVPAFCELLMQFRELAVTPTRETYPALYPSYSDDEFEAMLLAPDDDSPRRDALLARIDEVISVLGAPELTAGEFNTWLQVAGQMRRTFTTAVEAGAQDLAPHAQLAMSLYVVSMMALEPTEAERRYR